MILSEALHLARHMLSAAKIDDAFIEAELLLCHVLGISKIQLYSEPGRLLDTAETEHLQGLVQRRLLHEPTAYILKSCQFYGIDFYIDHRALIPRPETELLVEKTIEFAHCCFSSENQLVIADIGTGSGAIAVSLALTLPKARIYATDISFSALQVAEKNCQRYKVDNRVELFQGNLLEPLPEPVNVIVANLPYIKICELGWLSPEIINFEPIIALAGGENGLDKIHCLLDQTPGKIRPGGCLFLEVGQYQDRVISSMVNSHFSQANIELIPDLSGINRVVKVML